MLQAEADQAVVGRVFELLALQHLTGVETSVVIVQHFAEDGVGGIESLDDDLALPMLAPRPATDLHHELESALASPEIRELQQLIGTQYANYADAFKIQALRHHLGADQDIEPPLLKIIDDFGMGIFAAHRIEVHAADTGMRQINFELVLDFFGAEAFEAELLRAAGWAGLG